jgi:hypothetical protein
MILGVSEYDTVKDILNLKKKNIDPAKFIDDAFFRIEPLMNVNGHKK